MAKGAGSGDDLWKGLLAGMAAGLTASAAVSAFQALWTALEGPRGEDEEPTEAAARKISEGVFGHHLTRDETFIAGSAVHLGFGTATGGIYGAAAEVVPEIGLAGGLPFGAALWLVADEGAVPALGLSQPPLRRPALKHIHDLASHLVFGLTAEATRRLVRRALD